MPIERKSASKLRRIGQRRKAAGAARNRPVKNRGTGRGKKGVRPGKLRHRKPGHAALRLPAGLSAAAIVSVRNEERTIGRVLDELKRLPLQEIVVVLNGSDDGSFGRVFERDVTIVHMPEALGHDVGRAVGAKVAQAPILLFVDGDFPVPAERMAPFLRAVYRGADVALNDISPHLGPFRQWDGVSRVKAFLNRSLGRPDLGAASLTSVPHALSRRAVDTVGAPLLAVPPAAQAAAMLAGLTVCAPCSVNVIASNRHRTHNTGAGNPVARLIVGDHMEALDRTAQQAGRRLGWADAGRRRPAAEGGRGP